MDHETLNFSASTQALRGNDHGQGQWASKGNARGVPFDYPNTDETILIRNESPEYVPHEEVKRPSSKTHSTNNQ